MRAHIWAILLGLSLLLLAIPAQACVEGSFACDGTKSALCIGVGAGKTRTTKLETANVCNPCGKSTCCSESIVYKHRIGQCGAECNPGKTKCVSTKYHTCNDNYQYVDKGEVLGHCGVTPQFICEQRQGGTWLEGKCCKGGQNFNVNTPKVTCTSKPVTFFGITLFTKKRCSSTGGKTACFSGKPIPEKGVAVSKKVFNLGGKFVGCGSTGGLAGMKDTKRGGKLISFQSACAIIDFGNQEVLCTRAGVWETIKKQEDQGKSFLARRQPTLGKAKAGTQKCCPIDKCWNGQTCVGVGTEIEISPTKRIRCEHTTTAFK